MLSAAVASMSPKTSEYLRACLQQTGLVRSVLEWTISEERCPGTGGSVPDVVLLDLARETEASFAFAIHLRRLRPSVCIIACSHLQQPGPDMLMQAMRSGVQEFLPQPIESQVLRDSLMRFIKELGFKEKGEVEKLIVVMGAKGGVGTTTVSVNLGVQLAQLTQKRVVLLDFARPLGHIALLLDLQPRFTVRDAFENLERLDSHFFSGLLTKHKSGVELLAGTSGSEQWQDVPVAALTRVVNVAQSSAEFVVMDLSSLISIEWAPILRQARNMILVVEVDVPGLWSLERHVSMMGALGLDLQRLSIIVNRWHRQDEETLKAFEKKIKRPILARIPNDFRQVSEAVNVGTPLSRNHNDPLMSRFRQMAAYLGGITGEPKGERAGGILNLLGTRSQR